MIWAVRGKWKRRHPVNMQTAQRKGLQPELNPSYETAVLTEALLSNDSKAR